MQGYPALVDRGEAVDLVVMTGRREAQASTALGVRRLLLLGTSAPWQRVLARLSNAQKLGLGDNPHGSVPALLGDCLAAAVDAIVAERADGARPGRADVRRGAGRGAHPRRDARADGRG